jgi:predicted HAD superfamily Cof-like phosphohydrolase
MNKKIQELQNKIKEYNDMIAEELEKEYKPRILTKTLYWTDGADFDLEDKLDIISEYYYTDKEYEQMVKNAHKEVDKAMVKDFSIVPKGTILKYNKDTEEYVARVGRNTFSFSDFDELDEYSTFVNK